jgi:hypothetical protein
MPDFLHEKRDFQLPVSRSAYPRCRSGPETIHALRHLARALVFFSLLSMPCLHASAIRAFWEFAKKITNWAFIA